MSNRLHGNGMSFSLRDCSTILLAALLCPVVLQGQESGKTTSIYSISADSSVAREIGSVPNFPFINSPEISPDKKWVAVDGWAAGENYQDAHVLLVGTKDQTVRDLGKGTMPNWSSDGKWIAFCKYGQERGVYIRPVDYNHEQLIDRQGWGIQCAPDDMKAAYSRNGNIVIYDFTTGTKRGLFPAPSPYSRTYWNLKWSPDAKRICFKADNRNGTSEIAIVNIAGEKPLVEVLHSGADYNPDIAWHPDGNLIALPRRPQKGEYAQIDILDLQVPGPPTLFPGQPSQRHNSGMSWSRDGKMFVFVSRP